MREMTFTAVRARLAFLAAVAATATINAEPTALKDAAFRLDAANAATLTVGEGGRVLE